MAESPVVVTSGSQALSSPTQCYSDVNKVDVPSQMVAVMYKLVKCKDKQSELVIAKVHPHFSYSKKPNNLQNN